MPTVCVYCGSQHGQQPAYAQAARELGRHVAERGWQLVYGGGNVGLMGEVADAVLAAGGQVVGVIPQSLMNREVGHSGLTELRVVTTMHERKQQMAELADVFIALPGGIGTFEELFEVWTWRQLGYHGKPIGLVNVAGYYDGLLQFIDHAVADGFLRGQQRELLQVDGDARRLFDRLASQAVPARPAGGLDLI